MAHESSPSKRFRFSFYAIAVTDPHTRLLGSHEGVYSDSCSSFLCPGLSTLLASRMVFNRVLRLYPQTRGCSRLRLCPPRSDHQFRTTEERLCGTRMKGAWDYRSPSQGSKYRPGCSIHCPRNTTARATFSDEQLPGSPWSYKGRTPLVILSQMQRFSLSSEFLDNSIAIN